MYFEKLPKTRSNITYNDRRTVTWFLSHDLIEDDEMKAFTLLSKLGSVFSGDVDSCCLFQKRKKSFLWETRKINSEMNMWKSHRFRRSKNISANIHFERMNLLFWCWPGRSCRVNMKPILCYFSVISPAGRADVWFSEHWSDWRRGSWNGRFYVVGAIFTLRHPSRVKCLNRIHLDSLVFVDISLNPKCFCSSETTQPRCCRRNNDLIRSARPGPTLRQFHQCICCTAFVMARLSDFVKKKKKRFVSETSWSI